MKRVERFPLRAAALAALLTLGQGAAHADEREDLETLRQTTLNLIQALVQQGVLPADKADQLVKAAEAKAKATVAEAKKVEESTVRVQFVPESVRKQITEQVREEVVSQAKAERWGDVNAVPEWVDRFKFEGDVRLSYQRDMFREAGFPDATGAFPPGTNAPEVFFLLNGQDIDNTTEDRNRLRLRARLGVTARVTQDISAQLRLATGSGSEPVSTNQTLGNFGNKANFSLDRAFLRARSQETLPWLTVTAGRLPNPFFTSDLMFDDDLVFEGLALQFNDPTAAARDWRPFGTLGLFPLQDVQRSLSNEAKSKWLLAAQGGVEWVPSNQLRTKFGLGVYDYRNIAGERNDFDLTTRDETAPKFRQKGNSLFDIRNDNDPNTALWALAPNYKVLNVNAAVDYQLYNPVHLVVSADYVKNIGFDQNAIRTRTGLSLDPEDSGYMIRATLGSPEILLNGDWQLSLAYRYLEADAVLDAFTDSDFHLGGTNNKGFILGAQYGLSRNTWVNARWLSSREIRGLPLSINTMQVFFNARF